MQQGMYLQVGHGYTATRVTRNLDCSLQTGTLPPPKMQRHDHTIIQAFFFDNNTYVQRLKHQKTHTIYFKRHIRKTPKRCWFATKMPLPKQKTPKNRALSCVVEDSCLQLRVLDEIPENKDFSKDLTTETRMDWSLVFGVWDWH